MSDDDRVVQFAPKLAKPVVQPQREIIYPTVYRLTAFTEVAAQTTEGGVTTLAKLVPIVPVYLFNNRQDYGCLNPTWTPITRMDSQVDRGWVMVCHHPDESHAEGYIDSQRHRFFDWDDVLSTSDVVLTPNGVFSLTHRGAVEGAPSPLLIMVAKPHFEGPTNLKQRFRTNELYTIVHPDGTVTHDRMLLFPFLDMKE